MTKEETKDYNERCAKFLGGTKEIDGWNFCMSDFGINVIGGYGFFEAHDLKFHSDWNWIMKVLKRIKPLVCEAEFTHRVGSLRELDKQKVTKGIYEFLIWYNEKKPN